MTNAFKRIRREHEKRKLNAIEMICSLGNALLNLQHISSQQVVHITLSLPLNHSSRECIFINITPMEECTFILKPSFLLKHEDDNSENVMCSSIIDYYINRPNAIKHICLVEFSSMYNTNGTPISKRKKPKVI